LQRITTRKLWGIVEKFQFRPTESGLAAWQVWQPSLPIIRFQFRPTESGLAALCRIHPGAPETVSIPSHGIWSCSTFAEVKRTVDGEFQFRPTESGLAAISQYDSSYYPSCFNSVPRNLVLQPQYQQRLHQQLQVSIPSHGIWSCSIGLGQKGTDCMGFNSVPRNLVLQLPRQRMDRSNCGVSIPSHGIWSCSLCRNHPRTNI